MQSVVPWHHLPRHTAHMTHNEALRYASPSQVRRSHATSLLLILNGPEGKGEPTGCIHRLIDLTKRGNPLSCDLFPGRWTPQRGHYVSLVFREIDR
jgi:hypothetical protein